MERVELCCGGKRRGEITLQPQGQRMEIRAAMEDPGDGLFSARSIERWPNLNERVKAFARFGEEMER